ncbi:LuxR C-terminal-related transcriptional regulator [Actinomadura gamaensis]|uniref:LuxR C-terminal-related transcriptional regulator n=1 Tax=Actinomadura gamaensis TaxID=1763541 RepID=A0ABV9U143_9ACTN
MSAPSELEVPKAPVRRVPTRDAAASPAPDEILARPRLIERIGGAAAGTLTVVAAPPGSGKSAAVESWAAVRRDRPVVWMRPGRPARTVGEFCAGFAAELADAGVKPGGVARWRPRREVRREPGREPRRESGRELRREPGRDLRRESGRDLRREPGRDLRRESGRDLRREPGRDLRREAGRELRREPGRELRRETGWELRRETRRDLRRVDALSALAAVLAGLEAPVTLVLEDFPPERDSVTARCVTYLLDHARDTLGVIVVCSAAPPLPLRRLALAGRLTEVGMADLAFGEREVAAVLAQHGVSLGPSALRALTERTGGWAAAVRFAAFAMRGHPDPDSFAERYGGGDPAIVEFLDDEVLDAQPADVRRFLLGTSVLDQVNAELAAVLLGEDTAAPGEAGDGKAFGAVFAERVRRNCFFRPAGDGWFRPHRVFREAFRTMLLQESPGRYAVLHRRAAAWFDRAGHLAEAVRHAGLAGDWRYAAWIAVDRLAVGRVIGLRPDDPLTGLFRGMPRDLAFSRAEPEPAVVAAAVAVADGDERRCAVTLQHAGRVLASLPAGEGRAARFCAEAVRLARDRSLDSLVTGAGRAAGDPDALPFGSRDRALEDNPELRALFTSVQAAAHLRGGRLAEAARSFEKARAAADRAGGDHQRRLAVGYQALCAVLLGRVGVASALVARASQFPEVSVRPPGRRVAAVHLAAALVHLERWALPAMREELDAAGAALRARPDALLSLVHRLAEARWETAEGRPGRALELLAASDGRGPAARVPWLERRLRLAAAEAHVMSGASAAARDAAERAGGAGTPASALALACAEACGDDPAVAAVAAESVRRALVASAGGAVGLRVAAWLLAARFAYGAGNASEGRRGLYRALRLANRDQIRLPFALAAPWLRPVLFREPELARSHGRLLGPLRLAPPARPPDAGEAPAVGELSPRELDVLSRVARMMTTEEVADDLCLSVNTIKTHLKSIYRKLGVTRRGEAVRRARSLGLLAERA